MLIGFHHLNELKISLNDYLARRKPVWRRIEPEYWSNEEFLQWILQHPTQLTNLSYKNNLIEKPNIATEHFVVPTPLHTSEDVYNAHINIIIHQKEFLHHLSYLNLSAKFITDVLYSYLLQHETSIVFFYTIKELFIIGGNGRVSDLLYITDWLDTMSNWISLRIQKSTIIHNSNDLNNSIHYNNNSTYLHELIVQRKLNQQQQRKYNRNGDSVYKLKKLILQNCNIYMKYGLNHLFNQFYHLEILKLWGVKYAYLEPYIEATTNHFNFTNSFIDILLIKSLQLIPWKSKKATKPVIVTKLIIHETISNVFSTIDIEKAPNSFGLEDHLPTNLYFSAKYIDRIVFKSY
ncbi:unnamed protein product [Cunninghamella blakesleeana]